jgi:3-deoxy-manno-octulosonate cytidylyltransferase (CMP-KDO synthetase)
MNYSVVIPARYGSSRLLGKPLLDIAGKPMVQRVYERACESSATRVVIATDDERIRDAAVGFGAQVCMTSTEHPSGTDRIEEVTRSLDLSEKEIVVNVQGDEPLIPPAVIDQVAANLAANEDAGIATLSEPIQAVEELFNPNVVKVVCDERGRALYFSRAPLPWNRDAWADGRPRAGTPVAADRHLGIYAYRVSFLRSFVTWPPAHLETTEALEQLRAMAHGVVIHVQTAAETVPPGVDTVEDLEHVRAILAAKDSR